MAKSRTDKSRYPSRYSPAGWVTEAQYILELVCENEARKDKQDLPFQFWQQEKWRQRYKMQLRKCHALLKKYDGKAIIEVLKRGRIYSLFAPWLEKEVAVVQKQLDKKREEADIKRAEAERLEAERPKVEYVKKREKTEKNARSSLFDL